MKTIFSHFSIREEAKRNLQALKRKQVQLRLSIIAAQAEEEGLAEKVQYLADVIKREDHEESVR